MGRLIAFIVWFVAVIGAAAAQTCPTAPFCSNPVYDQMKLGAATGGMLGSGTLNLSGGAFRNGVPYLTNPGTLTGHATLDLPLTGGALSGGLTTIGITDSGGIGTTTLITSGNITIGSGSGATRFTQGGTGNWIFQSGGAAATGGIYSGNSGSPPLLTWASATNNLTAPYSLTVGALGSGAPVWSGAAIQGMVPLYSSLAWTGTETVVGASAPLGFYISDTTGIVGTNGVIGGVLNLTPTAASQGNVHGLGVGINVLVTTANVCCTGVTFGGVFPDVTINAAQGGTGVTATTSNGNAIGINPVVNLGTSAVNINGETGNETDVSNAGTTYSRVGQLISLVRSTGSGGLNAQGAGVDAALVFNDANAQSATEGWGTLIQIDSAQGSFPVATGGTIMGVQLNASSGETPHVANILDFHLISTVTAYDINMPGPFTVTGAGIIGSPLTTWTDTQTCTAGQIAWDASFLYVCTATNTVKRAALSTF